MELLKLNTSKSGIAFSEELKQSAMAANSLLHSGKGAGNDFLGWVNLPSSIDKAQLDAINACAASLRAKAEVVICIGIGGSYLGAKAVIDALSNPFELLHSEHKNPIVLFAGQNISEDYMAEMMEAVKNYSIATIVISKSGTTTEPAIAFRIIKEEIEKRYGKEEAKSRIVAITHHGIKFFLRNHATFHKVVIIIQYLAISHESATLGQNARKFAHCRQHSILRHFSAFIGVPKENAKPFVHSSLVERLFLAIKAKAVLCRLYILAVDKFKYNIGKRIFVFKVRVEPFVISLPKARKQQYSFKICIFSCHSRSPSL